MRSVCSMRMVTGHSSIARLLVPNNRERKLGANLAVSQSGEEHTSLSHKMTSTGQCHHDEFAPRSCWLLVGGEDLLEFTDLRGWKVEKQAIKHIQIQQGQMQLSCLTYKHAR